MLAVYTPLAQTGGESALLLTRESDTATGTLFIPGRWVLRARMSARHQFCNRAVEAGKPHVRFPRDSVPGAIGLGLA